MRVSVVAEEIFAGVRCRPLRPLVAGLVCRRRGLWPLVQVSVVLVVTLVSGRICTSVTTGSELSMDTVSVPWAEPPSASVAVTRQRMLSPGSTTDGDKVRVSVVAEEIFAGVPVPPACLAHW